MINSEQIQALKAAVDATPATEWKFHERHSLSHVGDGYVSIDGREAILCLSRPVGGIAHSCAVLRYIAAANPAAILSLLAERDADNALIDEQAKRIAELEAHTLTVKLPEPLMPAQHNSGKLLMTPDNVEQGGYLNRDDVLRVLRKACAAAGITLDVGE